MPTNVAAEIKHVPTSGREPQLDPYKPSFAVLEQVPNQLQD